MGSIARGVSFAGVLCALTVAAQAADGVLMVQKTTVSSGEPRTNQIHIESKRMRAESTGPRGEKQIVLFDGVKQVMTLIDNEKKTYSEMTKADIEAIGGQMTSMMAQMEQQLKSLPPEQRAQIEQMMKGRGMPPGAASASKVQYKKVGTDTVGKWTCDKYEGYTDGQKTSDVCTVEAKTLGLSPSDFEISREVAAFFAKLMPASTAQAFNFGIGEQGLSGVPVKSVTTVAGRQITTEMTEVSRQTFADAIFEVPAGYAKQPFLGRGRK